MISKFELAYVELVEKILAEGEHRQTRNHPTLSIFGEQLKFDAGQELVLLQGRKMFYKGIFGELAAILRGPKTIEDFEKWGCNYWKKWAKEDGSLVLDYGNAWLEDNQIEFLKECLNNDRTNRRMIINAWRPNRLSELSLPCCHYGYQFYVRDDKFIDMIWNQRSVDTMIGLPSDMLFAQAWLIAIANEFNLKPGIVTMNLGDCHIYEDHIEPSKEYLSNIKLLKTGEVQLGRTEYNYIAKPGKNFLLFEPNDIQLTHYEYVSPIKFELHE